MAMPSQFISDFLPAKAIKRLFPKHAPTSHKTASFHLRNIYIVPSMAGLGLVGLLFLLLIAAINFQNSLIYMVCFWLGALLVINILYTFRNLSGLKLKLLGTDACFAGQNSVIHLSASRQNTGKKESIYIGWRDEKLGADLARIDITDTQTEELKLSYPAPERGILKPKRLDVFTLYPTGLTVAWAYARLDIKAIVYPKPIDLSTMHATSQSSGESDEGIEIKGGVSDFAGIRNYQTGDSLRQVHWAKYAQTGKLYTKEFVDYASQAQWLDWQDLPTGSVEQRLSYLCALVLKHHQEQTTFGLRIPGNTIEPNQGEAHRNNCLTALALFPDSV